MKKIALLSVVTASLVMAGGDINPVEPTVNTGNVSFSNISLTDYKVIEGSYTDAYLNGGVTVESGNQDQTSFNGFAGARTTMLYTSAPYSWSLAGQANGQFSRGPNDGDKTEKNYDAFLSTKFDKYIFNDDSWFVYGGADAGYRKQSTADQADDPYFKVGAGAGYGRMYDATPMAAALRIVEDLVAYKLVKPDISTEAISALARIIDIENEYQGKYDSEYRKYWYQAMEDALKEHGALVGDSLGAIGIVRITEVFEIERIYPRFHGWKVRGGFGKIVSNYDGESENPTFDLGFEYGLPIGLQSQFTENATFSKVLDDASPIDYNFVNLASYTYEISNRIDWENRWTLQYDAYDEGDNVMSNTISTGFRYYLANRLTYDATLSMTKTDGTNGLSIATPEWDTKLYTGITYRLR